MTLYTSGLTTSNRKDTNYWVCYHAESHVLIDFIKTHQTINLIIGNGKRFMAYSKIRLKLLIAPASVFAAPNLNDVTTLPKFSALL